MGDWFTAGHARPSLPFAARTSGGHLRGRGLEARSQECGRAGEGERASIVRAFLLLQLSSPVTMFPASLRQIPAPPGWPSSWSSRIPKAGKPFGTAGVGAWPSGGLSFVPSSRVVISPDLRVAPALTRRRTRPAPAHSPVGMRFCLAARSRRPLSVQGHDARHYGADLWKPAPLEAGPSADVTPKSRVRAGVGVRVPRGPSVDAQPGGKSPAKERRGRHPGTTQIRATGV